MIQPKPDEFTEDSPASDENDGTEFPTDEPAEG
jgi:hypothetical protein